MVQNPALIIPMLRFDAIPTPVNALLDRLTRQSVLDGFALGDGTSLALRFGHRLSVDLDFFTTQVFSPDELIAGFKLDSVTITARSSNSLTIDSQGVKIDCLRHAYALLEPAEIIDGITLVSLPDLAAMKLNAIANRGSKKDFFDLVELLLHFTMEEMLQFFGMKYKSSDPFTVIRSLAWFEDAESEPDPISLNGLTWEQAKAMTSKALEQLS